MARLLKAYLLLRSRSGDWSVNAYRDFDDLTLSWAGRTDPGHNTGVIHVGFDHPPSQNFEALAARLPGMVLLTSAAKFALPNNFDASTTVGIVDGCPVYLASIGCGYRVVDDTVKRLAAVGPKRLAFEGWVAAFVAENTDSGAVLAEKGVLCEHDYLVLDCSLPRHLRKELGVFRFRYLIGEELHNPCAVARCSPPWLAERLFSGIDLSSRVLNVFTINNIKRVKDLENHTFAALLRTPNFGLKSVDDLLTALNAALKHGPAGDKRLGRASIDTCLISSVRRSLLGYAERERDIVSRRMGLNGPTETLQQISSNHALTRERVRQIERKVVNRLVREEMWPDVLLEKLTRLLKGRDFPLPIAEMETVDPWFVGITDCPEAMRYILENICPAGAGVVCLDGVEYCALISQSRWDSTIDEARRVLSNGADRSWLEFHRKVVVESLLPESASEFRSSLWARASATCNV